MERERRYPGGKPLGTAEGAFPHALSATPSSTVSISPTSATGSASGSSVVPASMSFSNTVAKSHPRDENIDRVGTAPPIALTHPFANSKAKLQVLPSPSTADGIDLEEEARLYADICGSYEDETDAFTRSNTPLRKPSKVIQAKPPLMPSSSSSSYTRRRRPASLPPESIFSADIFLADNTGQTYAGAAPLFAQDVRITGWSTVGDGGGEFGFGSRTRSIGGGGAYVVYDCVITTREGTTMRVLKRYSAFEELRVALKRSLPPSLVPSLPKLPPKAALARFRPAFLDSRRKHLQFFLASVLLHPEIGGREVVRRWVLS